MLPILLDLAFFAIALSMPFWMAPDSASYLNFSEMRTFLYPAFINAIWPLGPAIAPWVIKATQTLALIAGVRSLRPMLRHLGDSGFVYGATALVIYGIMAAYRMPATLLSENLALPLFLVYFRILWEVIALEKRRDFCLSLLVTALIAVRPMFLYLLPVTIALLGLKRLTAWFFPLLRPSLLLIALPVLGIIGDNALRWHYHGHFAGPPIGGFGLVSTAFFIAKANDRARLPAEDRPVFDKVLAYYHAQKMHIDYAKGGAKFNSDDNTQLKLRADLLFDAAYDTITNTQTPAIFAAAGIKDPWVYDTQAKTLSRTLIIANLKDFMRLSGLRIINGLGGFLLAAVFVLAWGLLVLRLRQETAPAVWFSFLGLSIAIANTVALGTFSIVINRYTLYGDVLLFAVVLYAINTIYQK